MKKVVVAFDVDGTLRCNCTETCEDPNERQIEGLKWIAHMKNTEVYIWSGGGAEYAKRFRRLYGLEKYVKENHCLSKLDGLAVMQVTIAVDDQQDFNRGEIQLIVREK